MEPDKLPQEPEPDDRPRRWRFRLSAILAFTTLTVFGLAGYRAWTDKPPRIGPGLGAPKRDLIDPPPPCVRCVYGQIDDDFDGVLRGQVVVVVEDLNAVDTALIQTVRTALPAEHTVDAIHFLEILTQNHGRLRSFSASGWELTDHTPGAFASLMALDQLAFKVPKEQRKRFGVKGVPTTIEFASGKKLLIEYTNDWGYFYLRKVTGDEELLRGVRVVTWESRETVDARQ